MIKMRFRTLSVLLIFCLELGSVLTMGSACNNEECLTYEKNRERKQQDRNATFSKYKVLLTQFMENKDDITRLPFETLVSKLQTRELNAVTVLAAFMDKALKAQEEFNCMTEFAPDAVARAQELDNSPTIKGPLHGLPVCFKENTDIKGMDSTLGYSKLLYQPARKSAVIVRTFEDLGAVPFCKTNVPQTLISTGSANPIYGETLNPLNKKLIPGGSTSGTACMVAAGALKIGTATDIGGSARIPAHYTGVSGISLTQGRISGKGIVKALPNIVGLKGTAGLIADKPSTIAAVFKELVSNQRQYNYDPLVVPTAWDSHLFQSSTSLRIGYFTSLGFFPSIGDTPKTVLAAKAALESRGHKLISIENLIDSFEAFEVYGDLLASDNGAFVKEMLRNDEITPGFRNFHFLLSLPQWKRRLFTSLVPLPDRVKLTIAAGLGSRAVPGLMSRLADKNAIRDRILKTMEKLSLDLIISPTMPFPAPRADIASNLFLGSIYTSIWNLVEFPAGVVPFGEETATDISSYDDQGDIILSLVKNNIASSKGMPISVQVIGRPFQDELILRIMNELDLLRDKFSLRQQRVPLGVDIRSYY